MEKDKLHIDCASFRDISGFVYSKDGILYRQINFFYKDDYEHLMNSGLYKELVISEYLIAHEESTLQAGKSSNAYKIIRPKTIPFISYPYEWCFSQLKEAALLTLNIQKIALKYGMSLKDASAYNIQFLGSNSVFIDTLSFERYKEGTPWVAYRQFCQHFLAPLALMSWKDIRLNQLFRIYIDGIPLDLASMLLPMQSRLVPSLLAHIHLHSGSQKHFAAKSSLPENLHMSRTSLNGLIDNLESTIKKMSWRYQNTEWSNYYDETNYSQEGLSHKSKIVGKFLDAVRPKIVWDLGANDGKFSNIAAKKGAYTLAFDNDPDAVEKNWHKCAKEGEKYILPLVLDLSNPSGGLGWGNEERRSLEERGPADVLLALALVHHLRISANVPLRNIAEYFSRICRNIIIEFVPKDDSQVKKLLATRHDLFPDYEQGCFEREFGKYFLILDSVVIKGSSRTLYLMCRK